jgi:hypothetical protein
MIVLVLKELAENLPTLFNVHVATFLDNIWQTLRDPKVIIREAAVEALHHCLLLIAKRVTKLRATRYNKIFMEVQTVTLASTSSLIIAINMSNWSGGDGDCVRYQ